ncbi:hypothetical protein ACLOJK_013145, partial [Asimina triloba]
MATDFWRISRSSLPAGPGSRNGGFVSHNGETEPLGDDPDRGMVDPNNVTII